MNRKIMSGVNKKSSGYKPDLRPLENIMLSTIERWLQLLTTLIGIVVIIISLLGFRRAGCEPVDGVWV
jgi:hypothetical protein